MPAWQAIIPHSRQPLREASMYIHSHYPEATEVYSGITWRHIRPYSPRAISIDGQDKTIPTLLHAEEQAEQKHQPCIVWFSGNIEERAPKLWQHLLEKGYRQITKLEGWSEMFDIYIYELPPPSEMRQVNTNLKSESDRF
jgi:hypothetical protein